MQPDKSKPEHNPWYLLATLHGEAASAEDEVHARNRTNWNRFMASELTQEACEFLIKEGRCPAEDLKPFSAEELADVEKLFAERHWKATGGSGTAPPLPNMKREQIDFSNVTFDYPFHANGFLFPMQNNVEFPWTGLAGPPSGLANFSGANFLRIAYFWNAIFFGRADFSEATFLWPDFRGAMFAHPELSRPIADFADFSRATFLGMAYFSNAIFSNAAMFSGATFSGGTNFSRAQFSDQADFSGTTFSGPADFQVKTFSGRADFSRAHFSGEGDFSRATFKEDILFVNAEMKGPTSFEHATFSSSPPKFFGATLHEGTVWRGVPPWPLPSDQEEAGRFVDAYERLKLEMDRLKKHEDELNFFALELQSRRVLDGDREQQVSELKVFGWTVFLVPPSKIIFEKIKALGPGKLFRRYYAQPLFAKQARTIRVPRSLHGLATALYGGLSDYGRSYVRPLTGLLITSAIGVLPFWWHLCKFWQAAGLSLANTLGVLGFRRDLIDPKDIAELPGLLKAVAAAQTVAGIVLLFLLGLAIRNRFRMK